jgi:hypothetical protein
MDIKTWIYSLLAVFGTLFVSGVSISLISSQLQCSKVNWTESARQGVIWSVFPTIFYAISTYFEFFRNWFVNPLRSFGVSEEYAPVVGVGYVVMLITWVATVWNVRNTEKAACNPDVKEMTNFKRKLMDKLKAKQITEEKNAEKK